MNSCVELDIVEETKHIVPNILMHSLKIRPMSIYRFIVYVIIFFFFSLSICSADPSTTTRHLMREQASLLDFGLYKLEEFFKDLFARDPYVNPAVDYDLDSNRINIYVWNTGPNRFKTRMETKKWCNDTICKIRTLLAVDCSTLKSLIPTGNSTIYQYFSHEGYIPKNEPSNLGSELDKIVLLAVGAYWGNEKNSKNSKFIRCEVTLLGSEIMCSE